MKAKSQQSLKRLIWIGSSKKDLLALPKFPMRVVGYALKLAQMGERHGQAKTLKGFGGAGFVEILVLDEAGTYRAIYTVKIADAIIVLHVFQKKSKQGIKTPKSDMDLVVNRLKWALVTYKEGKNNEKE